MKSINSKPSFIDAHCHLDLYNEKEIQILQVVKNALSSGVEIIVANGVNPVSNRRVISLADIYPNVYPSLGLYPIDALKLTDKEIDSEIDFIEENREKILAIGEVGMDFKEDTLNIKKQMEIFSKIISLSLRINKPLIVHSRKAEKEVIQLLENFKARKVIMHCFSGKFSLVKKIIDNNWILTIPTSVKSSEHFQKVIQEAPIENLLCETDSPYLHPDKKWPNEPALVVESYKKIAQIKNLPLDVVKEKIFQNYLRIIS